MQVTFDTSANQLDTQFLESIKTLFQNKQIKITVQDTEKMTEQKTVDEVFGKLHKPNQKAISIEEMNQAIAQRFESLP
ncbi:hypothetical protein [Candidatus Albibeggiatoa sp. nov. NOAA]|uniref:hypothetical protein n=1 Tax=Candidatus Albibeggiatoa sp. nov. NOAA TaxID=3162724 RepID=UPI0032F9FEAC|nr:hypothetical protein [Thiotrichaceae bacterium]